MQTGTQHLDVVVGYDGTRESDFALEWAARVAQRRGCALQIICSTEVDLANIELEQPEFQEMYRRAAQHTADQGAERARQFTQQDIRATGRDGSAANALIDASNQASLVVIGHRARSMLADALLGSVAFKVTSYAKCPVAVIRSSPRPLPSMQYPVVVGVDGSDHGVSALNEAARLAADTGAFLRVVVAWNKPNWDIWSLAYSRYANTLPSTQSDDDRYVGNSERTYQQIVDRAQAHGTTVAQQATDRVHERYPDLKIESVIREGSADRVILDAARDASMIAVGARGLGDLKALQIGSISRKVMQKADCAVYVVR